MAIGNVLTNPHVLNYLCITSLFLKCFIMKSKIKYFNSHLKMKVGKKIITIVAISIYSAFSSQIIIGDAIGTVPATQKSSVLLEFAAGKNKGIILPYLRTIPSGPGLQGGTIILDATDPTKARVRYYAPGNVNANSNGWVDLSYGHEANLTSPINYVNIQPVSTGANAVVEDANSKVIIGATSTAAEGVLVLESTTKAMVLPIVANTNDVNNPAPGMMVYINKAGAKRLALYNGTGWTYWKP